MGRPIRVLIIEDSPDDTELLLIELRHGGYDPMHERVETAERMREALACRKWDIVIADHSLPHFSAPAALEVLRSTGLDLPFIIVSGSIGEDAAVAAMRAGAHDYIIKGNLARLSAAIEREWREAKARYAHRKAQEALRHNEDLLRRAFDQSPIGAAIQSLNGRFSGVNEALCRITGYTQEELLSRSCLNITHPDDAEGNRRLVGQLLAGDVDHFQRDSRFIRKDGSIAWVRLSVRLMRDAEGQAIYLLPMMEDITERKQAMDALVEQHAVLDGIINSTEAAIFSVDAQCRYTSFGRRHAEIMKALYNADIEKGKSFLDFITVQEDRAKASVRISRALRGETLTEETCSGDKRPSRRYFEVTHSPIRKPGGAIVGVAIVAHDITNRRQAEQSLRESDAKLRAFYDSAPMCMGVVELSQDDRDIIHLYDNPATCRFLGLPSDSTTDRTSSEMGAPPEVIANWVRHYRESQRLNQPVHFEYQHPILRGTRWLSVTVSCIGPASSDRPQFSYVAEDITQRKQAEDALRQGEEHLHYAQKMEAVGLLAGGVAHDFRNQLTIIKGFAEMLLRRSLVPAQGRRPVEQILQAVDRSTALTGDLLTFSSRQVMRPELVDINHALSEMAASLQAVIGEDVRLSIIHSPCAAHVVIDPGQFQQAIVNLAINARDAMPHGGSFTIEVSYADSTDAFVKAHMGGSPGPRVVVVVRDTGMGMDQETRQRIFEPFFTTKPRGQGTGLGLSMVYGFIQQSGGHIEVDTQPQQGTTFRLYFPLAADAQAIREPAAATPSASKGRGAILLVEDEKDIRELLTLTLEEFGYGVLVATNANEALTIVQAHEGPIDLLVTDVVMPGMNGSELAERLRSFIQDLPVLYVSGYPGEGLAQRGIDRGCSNLLTKPFTSDALLEAVRAARGLTPVRERDDST